MRFRQLSPSIVLAATTAAQIMPGHGVVVTEMPAAPKSVLLDVDLRTGAVVTLSRFAFDSNAPLGVAIDNVDRDLIVAVAWQNGTRLLRLPIRGRAIGAPRILADINGKITDLELGFGASIFFTIGGGNGGVFAIPRNGGPVRRVTAVPRARGIFNFGQGVYSGFVLQAGSPGQPVVDPRVVAVNYDNGRVVNSSPLTGYRPLDVTDLVVLPNAVLNKLVTNADGTVGEVIINRMTTLALTPKLPAGATRRIRTIGSGTTPYVLGGKSHPRIKTFPGFANGPNRAWTMVTGVLPGDPVDFDIAPGAGAKTVALGRACMNPNGMRFGFRGGRPSLGNGQFVLQLFFGLPNSLAVLVLGVSDDRFAGAALPLRLAGGCELYTSAEMLLFSRTDQLGIATVPLPVPNNPALVGAIVFAQWGQDKRNRLDTSSAVALHLAR